MRISLLELPAVALLYSQASSAQALQQFEVAVIRPDTRGAGMGTSFNVFDGGRLRIINEPVKLLIRTAFQLPNSQIAGGPDCIETDRYDVEAQTGRPEKPAPGELAPMMRNLLIERFQLKFHHEKRELSAFALVLDKHTKGPPKLKEKTEGEETAVNTHGGAGKSELSATAVSMGALAFYVGNRLGRIVVDKTALSTALHEQLGLKLSSQKAPVEVLVIDSIQRPSEN